MSVYTTKPQQPSATRSGSVSGLWLLLEGSANAGSASGAPQVSLRTRRSVASDRVMSQPLVVVVVAPLLALLLFTASFSTAAPLTAADLTSGLEQAVQLEQVLSSQQPSIGQAAASQLINEASLKEAEDDNLLLVLEDDELPLGLVAEPSHSNVNRRLKKRSGISDHRLAEIQMIRALKKQLERASKLAASSSMSPVSQGIQELTS